MWQWYIIIICYLLETVLKYNHPKNGNLYHTVYLHSSQSIKLLYHNGDILERRDREILSELNPMARTYGTSSTSSGAFPDGGTSNYLFMMNNDKEGPADLFC